ncbi:hypothetical protein ACIOEW_07765 [Streptomyces sp. NPDC087901]|uniref:hypothetical protein n=1 Tax=Streptomyces sp. NPDC087901 TaxID=3365818 RepID=UPI00381745C4
MTPLPGPPRGNAPPGSRPDGPAHPGRTAAARQFLVALLLAVLAVAGGAPAAAGAGLPIRSSAGTAPTADSPAGIRPFALGTDRSLRTDRTVRTHPTGRAPGDRDTRTTPGRSGAVTAAGVHRPGPATAPQPWAAAEHPRTPQHLPPPGPGCLPPLPPGVPLHHPVPGPAPAAPAGSADRFRAALPGVRGPPRTAAHRSGDPSPVPPLITAVPFTPS